MGDWSAWLSSREKEGGLEQAALLTRRRDYLP